MKDYNNKFDIKLTNEKLELSELIKSDFGSTDGSQVIFLGITRDNNFEKNVEKLFYESYKDMALKELEKIIYKIFENWEVSYINIVHRLGTVLPSELSMILSVKSKHRKESFEASQYFID